MTVTKVLPPVHTSFESAFVVDSYPYGSLRTEYRIWIETKAKQGQRVVTCTKNPKTQRYNKPHAGTYSVVEVLFLDEIGHVHNDGLSEYQTNKAGEFLDQYKGGIAVPQENYLFQLKAGHEALKQGFHPSKDRDAFYEKINAILKEWGKEDITFQKK